MQPLRLLIVEDVEEDATLLVAALARGYDVHHHRVDTTAALRDALGREAWDLLVTDHSLPRMSPMDVLGELRLIGLDLPCIVYSGTVDEEAAVEALRAGARDFVSKNRLARLLPAVSRELREKGERREKRRATEALTEARERMRFALETAAVGTWEANLEDGTSIWSEMIERLHGRPAGAFGGRITAFIDSIHPDDRQRVSDHLMASTHDRSELRFEYRVTWPDDSTHWIAGIGRTVHDVAGRPVRAAGVAMDITAQKSLEDQVRHAQRMESIGSLASGIAHDFNNVLMAILGFSNLLLEEPFVDQAPEHVRRDIDQIRKAGERAAILTGQLLAFSRKQVLQPTVLSVNTVVTNITPMLERLIDATIRLTTHLENDLGSTHADAGQMEQVIMNLVVNSRDAMPDGGVITIETENVDLDDSEARRCDVASGPYIMLSVSDTGIGMSPDVRAKIFEPFFTTKPVGRGTGLGLATIFGIVKQHAGHISVASELGRGSQFRLYFPRVQSPIDAAPEARQPGRTGSGETVLLVEDDDAVRALAQEVLTRSGYHVLEGAHAEAAGSAATAHKGVVDVLVTDVAMPGASGRTLADRLLRRFPDMKVLYMSGYSDDGISGDGALPPGVAFLQKPFTAATLKRAVREALDR